MPAVQTPASPALPRDAASILDLAARSMFAGASEGMRWWTATSASACRCCPARCAGGSAARP